MRWFTRVSASFYEGCLFKEVYRCAVSVVKSLWAFDVLLLVLSAYIRFPQAKFRLVRKLKKERKKAQNLPLFPFIQIIQ